MMRSLVSSALIASGAPSRTLISTTMAVLPDWVTLLAPIPAGVGSAIQPRVPHGGSVPCWTAGNTGVRDRRPEPALSWR